MPTTPNPDHPTCPHCADAPCPACRGAGEAQPSTPPDDTLESLRARLKEARDVAILFAFERNDRLTGKNEALAHALTECGGMLFLSRKAGSNPLTDEFWSIVESVASDVKEIIAHKDNHA